MSIHNPVNSNLQVGDLFLELFSQVSTAFELLRVHDLNDEQFGGTQSVCGQQANVINDFRVRELEACANYALVFERSNRTISIRPYLSLCSIRLRSKFSLRQAGEQHYACRVHRETSFDIASECTVLIDDPCFDHSQIRSARSDLGA